MKITNIRINGIVNPVGFSFDRISCSWCVVGTESKKQSFARIEVSKNDDFSELTYVKEGKDLCQQGEVLLFALEPRTRYYYRIQVTGDQGDTAVSETAYWETGKMSEKWEADWIAPQKEDSFHPVLHKEYSVKAPVKCARLYATGVGMFEAWMDNKKLGQEYLMPCVNNYEKNIQTMTFPLENLGPGTHSLDLLLGKGWYMGVFGLELQKENYGNRMAAIAELHLEYEDGTKETVLTDDTWTYCGSCIEDSGIYDGEVYNELLWENKDNPKKQVEVIVDPAGDEGTKNLVKEHLMDRLSLPVLIKETLPVQEIIYTPDGDTVLDFGQNFAGFVSFSSRLPRGTKITLECAEILQEGNFYHGNYRDAASTFVYISDGQEKTVRPHFTFFGFRYIRVTGWPGEINKEDFTGNVLYSDITRTGYIHTCNEKINRLYENTLWGLKSNFIDMPTDCPQRSERLGWTGDAQVFAPTASYHMDTRAFFHKFMKDLRDEQEFLDGGIPNYVPNIGHKDDCGSVWGDIGTMLPDVYYTYYGDLGEIEKQYPMMKDWVDYIDRQDAARGRKYLYDTGFQFGDWLALDGATPTSFKGSTDDAYIGSVYYYHSAQIVRKMAERLNKTEDAEHYRALEEHIRKAVLAEFFTPNGRLAVDTQAGYVAALKFGLYVDRDKLIEQFIVRLTKDMKQIKCGFVGAPLLCTVLAEAGLYELAYDFLLKEGFPSWLYSVNLGATTVWERWNSVGEDGVISDTGMNSLNHYSYGSVMEFVYAYAGGIRPMEPGFKKAIIDPHPDIRLPKLECRYDSVSGTYVCNWEICRDGMLRVHVEIPFNCEAYVTLPDHEPMTLGAGSYDFAYMPAKDLRKPYSKKSSLLRVAADPKAVGILFAHTPALGGIGMSGNEELGSKTLEVLSHDTFLPFDPQELEIAMKELEEVIVDL